MLPSGSDISSNPDNEAEIAIKATRKNKSDFIVKGFCLLLFN
jgi:hypothetical protein